MKNKQIADQIEELKRYIGERDLKNTAISTASIGWQIDHSFRVMITIIAALKKSTPINYKWKFNALRTAILTSGIIPRGKGKAPKQVMTKQEIFEERALLDLSEKAQDKLQELEQLEKNAFLADALRLRITLRYSTGPLSQHSLAWWRMSRPGKCILGLRQCPLESICGLLRPWKNWQNDNEFCDFSRLPFG